MGTSLRMYQDQTRLLTNHSWQAWRSIYNNQTRFLDVAHT